MCTTVVRSCFFTNLSLNTLFMPFYDARPSEKCTQLNAHVQEIAKRMGLERSVEIGVNKFIHRGDLCSGWSFLPEKLGGRMVVYIALKSAFRDDPQIKFRAATQVAILKKNAHLLNVLICNITALAITILFWSSFPILGPIIGTCIGMVGSTIHTLATRRWINEFTLQHMTAEERQELLEFLEKQTNLDFNDLEIKATIKNQLCPNNLKNQ